MAGNVALQELIAKVTMISSRRNSAKAKLGIGVDPGHLDIVYFRTGAFPH
jgi:hypothetical protein